MDERQPIGNGPQRASALQQGARKQISFEQAGQQQYRRRDMDGDRNAGERELDGDHRGA